MHQENVVDEEDEDYILEQAKMLSMADGEGQKAAAQKEGNEDMN